MSIRIFPYTSTLSSLPPAPSSPPTPSPPLQSVSLNLSLANKNSLWLLLDTKLTTEPVWCIINSCAGKTVTERFPLAEDGQQRIWLKVESGGKGDEGREGILEQLVQEGIIQLTGIINERGLPLVKILLKEEELCQPCGFSGCGKYESTRSEKEERFKRCRRCKITYYCSTGCQNLDWKGSHKSQCLELLSDDTNSIQDAKRRKLLRLNGIVEDDALAGMGGKKKAD